MQSPRLVHRVPAILLGAVLWPDGSQRLTISFDRKRKTARLPLE